jgi:Fur family peroxide stress response transcriptional regulator
MKTMHGHPSPEEVYARVKKKVPAISLATVYKNLHLFVASGIFREVSMHHGSLRAEMNDAAHHHMVCSRCKAITDIGEKELGLVSKRDKLPGGFLVQRYAVDVIGLCAKCQ